MMTEAAQPHAANLGWECPRCHSAYAPWVASCSECKPPAQSLRERMAPAQPPIPSLPYVPYVPYVPVQPYPVGPFVWPPQPYRDQIVWCDTNTVGSGMLPGANTTVTWFEVQSDLRRPDDGTAGVPARV